MKRACRLVKVARQDCGLQACKTGARGGERLWLNKVGAFGVSSAAYHWSRLMPGLGRLVYYMWGRAEMAMLVFVDDLFWLTREKGGMEKILGSIFFMVILGLPFSRKKFCGGLQLSWAGFIHIGFERWVAGAFGSQICLDSQWRWVQCTVRIADRCAALERLSFALTALDHLRPFSWGHYTLGLLLWNARAYLQAAKSHQTHHGLPG